MKHPGRTLWFLPLLLLIGCATTQIADRQPSNPDLSGKKSQPPAYVSSADHIPVGGLPAVPRIVVDEQPLELFGFGLTPAERKKFDEERSQRIHGRGKQQAQRDLDNVDKQLPFMCAVLLPLCPLFLPMTYGVAWTMGHAWGRVEGAVQEPSLIPRRDGLRLAAAFKERATGASLQERTARLAGTGSRPAAGDEALPRLVIRLTAVQLNYRGREIHITAGAQAQAFASPSTSWTPTEHVYKSHARSLDAWISDNDALVIQEIEDALDALARNIWETYSPKQPAARADHSDNRHKKDHHDVRDRK
jgi:hypothetical protein